MRMIAFILIGFIAFLHIVILIVEMFLWNTPLVQSRFKQFSPEELNSILARNQGLYNGFLAAGLIWGLFMAQMYPQVEPSWIWNYVLICMVIAGIYASITLKTPAAIVVQSVPATIALLLLGFSNS